MMEKKSARARGLGLRPSFFHLLGCVFLLYLSGRASLGGHARTA
jgi:hypothetical protein